MGGWSTVAVTATTIGRIGTAGCSTSTRRRAPCGRLGGWGGVGGGSEGMRRRRRRRGERCAGRAAEGGRSERDRREEEERYAAFVAEAREWTMYDAETGGDAPPPWEKHLKEAMEEGPWPCWDSSIPESDFVEPPRYVSLTKAPKKFDPFEERIKRYKEEVRAEQRAASRATREEIKSKRYMSLQQDIRLKNKPEDDESAWDHEKIMELINFPEEIRHKMMSASVEVYDPRFPYDFEGMGAPPMSTEEFLDSIGRLQKDDETDLERVAKIAARTGSTVPELVEEDPAAILQQRSTFELQSAMDIGDDEEISKNEISDLIDSDDEV